MVAEVEEPEVMVAEGEEVTDEEVHYFVVHQSLHRKFIESLAITIQGHGGENGALLIKAMRKHITALEDSISLVDTEATDDS